MWFKIIFIVSLCLIVVGWPVVGAFAGFRLVEYCGIESSWVTVGGIVGCLAGLGVGAVVAITIGWWMIAIYLRIDEHIHKLEENMEE